MRCTLTYAMSQFQIFTEEEIERLRTGGAILRGCLGHVAKTVQPGMKTITLDHVAEEFIRSHGAEPAFKGYHNYPATLCTSVNDQCVHGVPGERILHAGDIVSLDCGVLFGGLYTDACITVPVGTVSKEVQQFITVTERALTKACAIIREGAHVGDISAVIQKEVEGEAGYHCVRALTGHGLGSALHQFPDIPNVGEAGSGPVLPTYTIVAIEPITAMGEGGIREGEDGWTIATQDGSLSAHFEHTVLVLPEGHEILA